jgi:hypothetical protein
MAQLSRNRDPSRADFAIRADAAVFTLPTIACSRAVRTGVGAGLTISGRGRARRHPDIAAVAFRSKSSNRHHRRQLRRRRGQHWRVSNRVDRGLHEGRPGGFRSIRKPASDRAKRVAVDAAFGACAGRQACETTSVWTMSGVAPHAVWHSNRSRRSSPRQTCGAVVWRWPCP